MLKLKLIYEFLKKYSKVPVVLIIAFYALIFVWNLRQDMKASERREDNLKSILFKYQKGFKTVAKVNKDLEGVYLLEQETSAHWKAVALSGSATQTELDSNRTKVEFDTTTACISLKGFTLTNPPYYEFKVKRQSFSLDIIVSDFENNIYSWTSTSPCIMLDTVKLEVAPDIKGVYKDNFDFKDAVIGGFIGISFWAICNCIW